MPYTSPETMSVNNLATFDEKKIPKKVRFIELQKFA